MDGSIPLFCAPGDLVQVQPLRERFEIIPVSGDLEFSAERKVGGGFYLRFHDDHLTLCQGSDSNGVWVRSADIRRRLRGEFALARACGSNAKKRLHILDATAGLGIDAMALRARGNLLTLVEREPVLWALLSDLLRRLDASDVTLDCADAMSVIAERTFYDVVYVDPMFPPRRKTALPNKRMQYLNALLGNSDVEDLTEFIYQARGIATDRVVLKRRLQDPAIVAPDWQILGKTIRYDVFRGSRRTA